MPLQKLEFRPGINREGTTLANEGGWFQGDMIRFRSGQVEKIGGWTLDTGQVSTGGNYIGVVRSMLLWNGIGGQNYLGLGTGKKFYIQNGTNGALYDVTPYRVVISSPSAVFARFSTTLNGTINATATSVTLTTTYFTGSVSIPSSGIILIGTEQIAYTGIVGFTLTGCTRGYNSTTAVSHTTGATVYSNTLKVTQSGYGAQTGDYVIFSGATSLGGNITAALLNQGQGYVVTYGSTTEYAIQTSVTANASDTGNGGGAVTASYQIPPGNDVNTPAVGWGAGGWSGVNPGYAYTGWGSPAPAGLGVVGALRLWSQANFGQNLIMNFRGGPLYYWVVGANPSIFYVAQVISHSNTYTQDGTQYWYADVSCPTKANYVMVSDASRFTIAFGTDTYGDGIQNPMLVSWSDQENNLIWTPTTTNQAGNFTLSRGSQIITAKQNRQEIAVWTDSALYSMQYLGAPYVWGFNLMMDNISIIAPNVTALASNVIYWMGNDKFYMYSGTVQTLPCTLREYVYQDINKTQSGQFFAGTNEGFNEVWWFYCSSTSDTIDRYVIYNYLEHIWYYGNMTRTAWYDSPLRTYPMAAGYNTPNVTPIVLNPGLIYHENGVDNGVTNPPTAISAYVQSSDFDISDGHNFGFVWRIIPDIAFNGSTATTPSANFTVLPRQNPGSNYGTSDNPAVTAVQSYQTQHTYNVQQFTQYAYCRIRGRQMAFIISSNSVGTQWQLGAPRLDVRPDGKR
jgi:hypothetical protein